MRLRSLFAVPAAFPAAFPVSIRAAIPAALLALAIAVPNVAQAKVTADVVYGHKAGMALVYDVFHAEEPNGAGVLFMVSGGWFSRWVPPAERLDWLQHLLDAGFTVFAVHHGSAPRFKVPEAVADVRQAVAHIRANAERFGVDAKRLGVHGGSAGGHLSLMLTLAPEDDNKVQAAVAYFPPVDLEGFVGPSERFPALDFDPALTADVSPIHFVSDDDPPVLLIHGDRDELVPVAHSIRLHEALDAAGVVNDLMIVEGAAHGFRGADRQQAQQATVAFFERYLGADGEASATTD